MYIIHTCHCHYLKLKPWGQFNKAFTSVFYKLDQFLHTLKHTLIEHNGQILLWLCTRDLYL